MATVSEGGREPNRRQQLFSTVCDTFVTLVALALIIFHKAVTVFSLACEDVRSDEKPLPPIIKNRKSRNKARMSAQGITLDKESWEKQTLTFLSFE